MGNIRAYKTFSYFVVVFIRVIFSLVSKSSEKRAYHLRHIRPSVCPQVSARLPLDGFP
jgi:hypothetical protein